MRILMLLLVSVSSFTALAKQVEVTCSTKAYMCSGSTCQWVATGIPVPTTLPMYKDPNYPNKDAPYDLYRATFQSNYDRHLLTLSMEAKDLDPSQPVVIKATLDGGSVFAEAAGQNQMDISLRNQNYGRGFSCTSFRILN